MTRFLVSILCLTFAVGTVYAVTKEQKRLNNCGTVMQEILDIPDNLPEQVLQKAECVIVFPHEMKVAFGMGKEYGRGAMICRTGKNFRGPWGAPAMFALEGDSIGMQIGGEATDLILLVMNPKGVKSILSSKIKLGGDASAAAGPKGRDASANTDAWMKAEILSYSRSKGLFAGISLEGSTLRQDHKANERIYSRKITAREILLAHKVRIPASGRHLVQVLQSHAPRNESKESASN
ncbi:MAG TPA: lipid-binding SYLF domain-containing protein [Candidatus Acidoferrum sp.]|nr:lipid-binding SYLF domain-containing protein [Candidatus Acidoferrum sp.]